MAKDTFTLTDNRSGKAYEYNIIDGTRGPSVVDIRTFYKDTGMFTYDPGYTSTASCDSKITFIDGENSELRYRGYDIADLAGKHSFLDVSYLLMRGQLPTEEASKNFDLEIRHRSFLNEGIIRLFDALPDGAHPMATMGAATMALAAFYKDHLHLEDEEQFKMMRRRILAKMPTIAAMAYRNSIGTPLIYPDVDKYFTENFLFMLRAYPGGKVKYLGNGKSQEIRQVEVDALDAIFTLHADHEQNASTTTVRNVGSTEAHPYVAIASGISALWGSAHGGANEKVMDQLRMIGDVKNVPSYIAKAKDGWNHSVAFTLNTYDNAIQISDDGAKRVQNNCISCHKSITSTIVSNSDQYHNFEDPEVATGRKCWSCHKSTPHGKVRGLSTTPHNLGVKEVK